MPLHRFTSLSESPTAMASIMVRMGARIRNIGTLSPSKSYHFHKSRHSREGRNSVFPMGSDSQVKAGE